MRRFAVLVVVCWSGLASVGVAQSPAPAPAVTDADIARVQREQPQVSEEDIARARRRYGKALEAEVERAAPRATPNVDALPVPAARGRVDLGGLARNYEEQASAMQAGQVLPGGPGLLIFVSFAMPQQTLGRLVDQAARAGATLVIRGFTRGSAAETVRRVQGLVGDRRVGVQIDPQAFDRFAVAETPTFVLVRAGAVSEACGESTCYARDSFVSASGDVSLDYALERFAGVDPRFAEDAHGYLARLRR